MFLSLCFFSDIGNSPNQEIIKFTMYASFPYLRILHVPTNHNFFPKNYQCCYSALYAPPLYYYFFQKSTYCLTIKAIDGGTPPLSDSTIVEIEVEDANDNAPIFKHCNLTAVVQVEISFIISIK